MMDVLVDVAAAAEALLRKQRANALRTGRPPAFKLEPGMTFGRLTVVAPARRGNKPAALCRCECGSETVVRLYKLASGHTKSCGCLKREQCVLNLMGADEWRRSEANRQQISAAARSEATREAIRNSPRFQAWLRSEANRQNLTEAARSEANAEGKRNSPAFQAHVARMAQDPDRRARAAERAARSLGTIGEWLEVLDMDHCTVHLSATGIPMDFADHKRTRNCVPGAVARVALKKANLSRMIGIPFGYSFS